MAKIALSKDAPVDGPVGIEFGGESFTVSAKSAYTTDDRSVIEQAQAHSYLEVEDADGDSKAAEKQAAELQAAFDARGEFKVALALKDPLDPAPDAPFERPATPATVVQTDDKTPTQIKAEQKKAADAQEAKP